MTAAVRSSPNAKVVVYDGIYTLAGRIIRALLALALSILVARGLGPYGRGLYALPAVYTGLVIAVFGGLSAAVAYFMVTEKAGRGVMRPALLSGAILSLLGAIPVAAIVEYAHNQWALLPSLLLLPLNIPLILILGYAIGTKRIRWQTTYSVLSGVALLVAMIVAFVFYEHTWTTAFGAYVGGNAAVAAGCLAVMLRDSRNLPYRPVGVLAFLLFTLRVGAVNLMALLNYRADLYVVALLTTPSVLGQYAVAVAAAEALLIVTQVAAVVTSPHVAAMERDDSVNLTVRCLRVTLVLALLICIALYAGAPYIIEIMYGKAYLPMVPALRILLVAVMILSLGTPISNFFTLKLGRPEVALVSAACAAPLCLAASWFLVPRIGMVGAAIATAIAYLAGEGTRMAFFIRITKTPLSAILIPTRSDLQSWTGAAFAVFHDLRRKIAAL